MDPKTRFLSAIALATTALTASGRAQAELSLGELTQCSPDQVTEEELFAMCTREEFPTPERQAACTCFLQSFPLSPLAPTVVSAAIDLGLPFDLAELAPAAGPPPIIYP